MQVKVNYVMATCKEVNKDYIGVHTYQICTLIDLAASSKILKLMPKRSQLSR